MDIYYNWKQLEWCVCRATPSNKSWIILFTCVWLYTVNIWRIIKHMFDARTHHTQRIGPVGIDSVFARFSDGQWQNQIVTTSLLLLCWWRTLSLATNTNLNSISKVWCFHHQFIIMMIVCVYVCVYAMCIRRSSIHSIATADSCTSSIHIMHIIIYIYILHA